MKRARNRMSSSKEKATSFLCGQSILIRKFTPAAITALAIFSMFLPETIAAIPLSTRRPTIIGVETHLSDIDYRNLQRQSELQQCKVALGVGDGNRDEMLGQEEYVLFVNLLASKQNSDYDAHSSFDKLPQGLKDNYNNFADVSKGGIDVAGFRPGSAATEEQDEQLSGVCQSTIASILDSNSKPKTPVVAPTSPPGDSNSVVVVDVSEVDCSKMIERAQCNVDLSISDSYQNDLLDESDYVKFVNRLSDNKYARYRFEELPSNIQENHKKFVTVDGQVDISGSKPGECRGPKVTIV